jgi:RNA polymerase sigma factor (sigma-70 family)
MCNDDLKLLREFAAGGSEAAFATLVQRHIGLVYSTALRRLNDPHEAEEVTQAVFIILAKKAASLRDGAILSGWLYQTAQLTAANFYRAAQRRRQREHEAYMQFTQQTEPDQTWQRLSPLLEEAMMRLGPDERDAVVLRFFESRTIREVAAALGLAEAAAQKRVNRATEKLRKHFLRHGVQVSAAALLASIGANAVHAAPAALTQSVTAMAITHGASVSGSTLTLIKGALKVMVWTKAKTAIVAGVGILLLTGAATVTVKTIEARTGDESWRILNVSADAVNRAAPQVRILPTKFRSSAGSTLRRPGIGIDKFVGINVPISAIASLAYRSDDPLGMPWPRERMIFRTPEPRERYDFISSLQQGSVEALRELLRSKLGFVARREMIETDVLILKVKTPNAPHLIPAAGDGLGNFSSTERGGLHQFKCDHQPLSLVANALQQYLNMPVIDQTGLTQHFNIDLQWRGPGGRGSSNDALKQAVLDQLGLELAPAREPIEYLVVEKAN